jgi:Protein of unknown function (DUF1353)
MTKGKESTGLGKYEGRAVVTFLGDGRRVRLVEAFGYVDTIGERWDVPAGAIVDGASIPQSLWSLVGGPFDGKYRDASVIHDWYCDLRSRPWKAVHRVFYEAMLTSGVTRARATLMYAAVYWGGPRWSKTVVDNTRWLMGHYLESSRETGRFGAKRFHYPMPAVEYGMPMREPYSNPVKRETLVYRYDLSKSDLKSLKEAIRQDGLDLTGIERFVDSRVESLPTKNS